MLSTDRLALQIQHDRKPKSSMCSGAPLVLTGHPARLPLTVPAKPTSSSPACLRWRRSNSLDDRCGQNSRLTFAFPPAQDPSQKICGSPYLRLLDTTAVMCMLTSPRPPTPRLQVLVMVKQAHPSRLSHHHTTAKGESKFMLQLCSCS